MGKEGEELRVHFEWMAARGVNWNGAAVEYFVKHGGRELLLKLTSNASDYLHGRIAIFTDTGVIIFHPPDGQLLDYAKVRDN